MFFLIMNINSREFYDFLLCSIYNYFLAAFSTATVAQAHNLWQIDGKLIGLPT